MMRGCTAAKLQAALRSLLDEAAAGGLLRRAPSTRRWVVRYLCLGVPEFSF
jgi:hypothetical protein